MSSIKIQEFQGPMKFPPVICSVCGLILGWMTVRPRLAGMKITEPMHSDGFCRSCATKWGETQ